MLPSGTHVTGASLTGLHQLSQNVFCWLSSPRTSTTEYLCYISTTGSKETLHEAVNQMPYCGLGNNTRLRVVVVGV